MFVGASYSVTTKALSALWMFVLLLLQNIITIITLVLRLIFSSTQHYPTSQSTFKNGISVFLSTTSLTKQEYLLL